MKLRDYQLDAIEAARGSLSKNRATIVKFATGLGKTIIASKVIEMTAKKGGRSLFLAHTNELVLQFEDKLKQSTGLDTLVEKAERTAYNKEGKIVCASIQSISKPNRLSKYNRDNFNLIFTDEVHRGASDSYVRVYDYFKSAKMIGLTATPFRTDDRSLGDHFDDVCIDRGLEWGIDNGWLVPIESVTIPLKIDLSEVDSSNGDFQKGQLADAITPVMEQVADAILEHGCLDEKVLVFLPTKVASKRFSKILTSKGFVSEHLDGGTKDREGVLRRFSEAESMVLCNPMVLSTGYDEPSISVVIDLTPTKSNLLYIQKIGRGLRSVCGHLFANTTVLERIAIIASSSKPRLRILDFLWHGATKNLSHPACLFAKSKEVEKKMIQISAKGGVKNLKEVEEEAHKELVSEREQALIDNLNGFRGNTSQKFDPVLQAVSLFDDSLVNWKPEVKWEAEPLSAKQEEYLTNNGFDCSGWKKGYASKVLASLEVRREKGLATPKQFRCLQKHGYPNAHQMSFADAKVAMDKLSKVWAQNKKWRNRRK